MKLCKIFAQGKNPYLIFFLTFQTEESLTNLQKSIHPMTLTKLQGLLDLQPENELKDDEIDNSDQLTKSSTTPDRM